MGAPRALICPNPACPYQRRFGHPAEYRPGKDRCSDCDAALVVVGEVASRDEGRAGGPVRRLEDLIAQPGRGEVGAAIGEGIVLRSSPQGRFLPIVAIIGALAVTVHASTREQSWTPVTGFAVLALLSIGAYPLLRREWRTRQIWKCEKGIRLQVGSKTSELPYVQLTDARVQRIPVRSRWGIVGWLVELCVSIDGRWHVLSSFSAKEGGAFERLAWDVVAASGGDQTSKVTSAGS